MTSRINTSAISMIVIKPEKSRPVFSVMIVPRLTVKPDSPRIQMVSRNSTWTRNPLKPSMTPMDTA